MTRTVAAAKSTQRTDVVVPQTGSEKKEDAGMEYRLLGNSGLRVSTITLGTGGFGNEGDLAWGHVDLAGARRQVDMAIDAGVNLIDTADVYAGGRSEEIIGEILKGKRDSMLISTKVRFPSGPGPNDRGLSRTHILRSVETSLRKMQTDHIDIYHAHEWDGQVPLEETLHAFDTLVRDGKVRYLGVSNFTAWQLMKALSVSELRGFQRIVSNQIYYSLQGRDAEFELLPLSVDQGLGVLVWSPLAGGLLTGKYRRDRRPEQGRFLEERTEPPVRDLDKLYDIIDVLVEIADNRGVPAAQVALAWTLGRPAVTSVIIGARTEEQLTGTLGAADIQLTDEERAALDEVSAMPLIYPHWHQGAIPAKFRGRSDRVLHGDR